MKVSARVGFQQELDTISPLDFGQGSGARAENLYARELYFDFGKEVADLLRHLRGPFQLSRWATMLASAVMGG